MYSMFIHTRLSAPERFTKFGQQTQTFCNKKVEVNIQPSFGQTDYIIQLSLSTLMTGLVSERLDPLLLGLVEISNEPVL